MNLLKTLKPLALISALWALPAGIHAQSADKPPTALQISVGDVRDNRETGFNSECTVELKLTGDAAMDARKVRRVVLTEATDETGHDLIPKASDHDFPGHDFDSEPTGSSLQTKVTLRNPSRRAGSIKVIKGQIELFNPTEANGGLLTLTNVLQHPAEPVQNPTLAVYNIQLMYLTKESYEAKNKELEAQQKTATDAAAQKLGEAKLGAAFREIFKGVFSGMLSDSKDSVLLYVKDPDNRIINYKFADAHGKPLESHASSSMGDFRSTDLDAPPPPDTQLILQLATPEALKSYPFKVENIPLP